MCIFSRNDCKYTWEKTARISCHNFETNGRPYRQCRGKDIVTCVSTLSACPSTVQLNSNFCDRR